MLSWLDNLSFSDIMLAGTALLTAIGAYFNINFKLNSVIRKVDEVEKSQENVARDLRATELETKKDLMLVKTATDARFSVLEERQRITDVFIGRFDEKINYIVDQIKQLISHVDSKNDK